MNFSKTLQNPTIFENIFIFNVTFKRLKLSLIILNIIFILIYKLINLFFFNNKIIILKSDEGS